jgi:protection-of-telomeres protein 1
MTTISHILDATNTRHTNTLPSGNTYHLPFINALHHIKARVVDFYPPKLVDFAVQISHDDDDDDNKSEYSVDMIWHESSPRWEWFFALQVEEVSPRLAAVKDAPPPNRIWLNVGHMEAQYLLGNAVDDPADLRENTTLLNQLREKLYILWGDLEEQKRSEDEDGDGERKTAKRAKLNEEQQQTDAQEQQPSNLPFNCCLREYGVRRDGGNADEVANWERQYMMFGVTIT